jgi:hypothetical protein
MMISVLNCDAHGLGHAIVAGLSQRRPEFSPKPAWLAGLEFITKWHSPALIPNPLPNNVVQSEQLTSLNKIFLSPQV